MFKVKKGTVLFKEERFLCVTPLAGHRTGITLAISPKKGKGSGNFY
jgi:hypothetical protein